MVTNRKKTWLLAIMAVSILILLFSFTKRKRMFSDCVVDEGTFNGIIESRTQSDSPLTDGITFGEEVLFYDEEAKTYYYSIIEGSQDAYNPTITIGTSSKDAQISIKESELKERELTSEIISENKDIEFVIYTPTEYETYTLKCTTLPLMNINVETGISAENTAMEMALFDNRKEAVQRFVTSEGFIHVRGGSTKTYPKLGYRVNLRYDSVGDNTRANPISLLGMRQDDDWILYAAYNDQEKIRNVFSMNLWTDTCGMDNSYGIEFGMHYKYIELFINGRYWGLYALGYPIDDLQAGVSIKNNDILYKNASWADENSINDTDDMEINGYKIVSTGKTNAWEPLHEYYDKLNNFYNTDSDYYYDSVDAENLIDYMLFINVIQGPDNISRQRTKNMYIVAKENLDETYTYLYTPWDLDLTWGNAWHNTAKNQTLSYAMAPSLNRLMESGAIYRLLLRHEETVWERFLEKWNELRSDKWSDDTIIHILDQYETLIFDSGAYLRDMEQWPDGNYENPDLGLSAFKSYVLNRLHEADEYYERLERVKNENVYIIRAAQYKYFLESIFLM